MRRFFAGGSALGEGCEGASVEEDKGDEEDEGEKGSVADLKLVSTKAGQLLAWASMRVGIA